MVFAKHVRKAMETSITLDTGKTMVVGNEVVSSKMEQMQETMTLPQMMQSLPMMMTTRKAGLAMQIQLFVTSMRKHVPTWTQKVKRTKTGMRATTTI